MKSLAAFFSICTVVITLACPCCLYADNGPSAMQILVARCFTCHGPVNTSPAGGLQFPAITRSAIPLPVKLSHLVEGEDSDQGELLRRVQSTDPDIRMPPRGPSLSQEEIKTLQAWVSAGALYGGHWAWETLKCDVTEQELPESWDQNLIDRIVAPHLLKRTSSLPKRAEPETQLRRVTLSLTGLPPTTEQVSHFTSSPDDDTYHAVVNELLASEAYGVHMGSAWLDVARYADTHGYLYDGGRSMWAYRDYVIDAFNRNIPFDEFTRQQLAGDFLPQAGPETLLASAFLRNNATSSEGGIDGDEYRAIYAFERAETVARVWLAMTLECARCHDHKYEPITQQDYFSFAAFFGQLEEQGLGARYGNSPPFISTPTEQDKRQLALLANRLDETRAAYESVAEQRWNDCRWWAYSVSGKRSSHLKMLVVLSSLVAIVWIQLCLRNRSSLRFRWRSVLLIIAAAILAVAAIDYTTPEPLSPDCVPKGELVVSHAFDGSFPYKFERNGEGPQAKSEARFEQLGGRTGIHFDGSGLTNFGNVFGVDGTQPFTVAMWIRYSRDGGLVSKIDGGEHRSGFAIYLAQQQLRVALSTRWQYSAIHIRSVDKLPQNEWVHVCVTYDGTMLSDGLLIFLNGEQAKTIVEMDTLAQHTISSEPLRLGSVGEQNLMQGAISDFHAYRRNLHQIEIEILAAEPAIGDLMRSPDPSPGARRKLLSAFESTEAGAAYRKLTDAYLTAAISHRDYVHSLPTTMIAKEVEEPRKMYVLRRGRWGDFGEEVRPGLPAVFMTESGRPLVNRKDLADWLVSPDNPLTARVIVNRVWAHHFGKGIVATLEDFGLRGESPQVADLLDALALSFVQSGWDLKALHRLIVESETFRQSTSPLQVATRSPLLRHKMLMSAESVRDSILFAGKLLDTSIGGKPFLPPAVAGFDSPGEGPRREISEGILVDKDSSTDRRTIFSYIRRNRTLPLLEAFDAADRSDCTVGREQNSRVAQALVLMNDVHVVRAACAIASQVSNGREIDEALSMAFLQTVSRRPSTVELSILRETFVAHRETYSQDPAATAALLSTGNCDPERAADVDLAAMTVTCQTLLMLPEFSQIP